MSEPVGQWASGPVGLSGTTQVHRRLVEGMLARGQRLSGNPRDVIVIAGQLPPAASGARSVIVVVTTTMGEAQDIFNVARSLSYRTAGQDWYHHVRWWR